MGGHKIYTWEYYLSIKDEILLFVAKWMDIEDIMLSEISKTQNTS
jgi:hypothetical protein